MLPLSRPPCTYIHTHTHHNILCIPTLVLLNPFYCVISISSGTTRNQGLHADSNLFWTQRRPVSPQPKIVPFSLSLLISFSLSFFLHCFLDWTYQLPSVKKRVFALLFATVVCLSFKLGVLLFGSFAFRFRLLCVYCLPHHSISISTRFWRLLRCLPLVTTIASCFFLAETGLFVFNH